MAFDIGLSGTYVAGRGARRVLGTHALDGETLGGVASRARRNSRRSGFSAGADFRRGVGRTMRGDARAVRSGVRFAPSRDGCVAGGGADVGGTFDGMSRGVARPHRNARGIGACSIGEEATG